ncbi:hypothetical protein OIO90_005022 [Microbotryomycetes sp. JL221]|nr:hypothetical protein OIO90_005022 [Microbotryomycetes sp. JL221]
MRAEFTAGPDGAAQETLHEGDPSLSDVEQAGPGLVAPTDSKSVEPMWTTSWYGQSPMPALTSSSPTSQTYRWHVMHDLVHTKGLGHRITKFLQSFGELDDLTSHFTYHPIWQWNTNSTTPVGTLAIAVSVLGIWTEDGSPERADTRHGLNNVIRCRLELPMRTRAVAIQAIRSASWSAPKLHGTDEWIPKAWHQSFYKWSFVGGTNQGEATSWNLCHGKDFPEGLPIIFHFDNERLKALHSRFMLYERLGEGVFRSRLTPGTRVGSTSPVVLTSQQTANEGIEKSEDTAAYAMSDRSDARLGLIKSQDPLYNLSRYISEFLLTMGDVHFVANGWRIRAEPVDGSDQLPKVYTVEGAFVLHRGKTLDGYQRVWRALPELPAERGWISVLHSMARATTLDHLLGQHNTTNAKWIFVKRELRPDEHRKGWRQLVATSWEVSDFPIFGNITVHFVSK